MIDLDTIAAVVTTLFIIRLPYLRSHDLAEKVPRSILVSHTKIKK